MSRKIWTRGLNGFLVVLCLGYILWPYGTVVALRSALKSADEVAVAGWVDWPALQSGFRNDLKKRMISSANESLREKASGMKTGLKTGLKIRMSFGSASIVDRLVDILATPRGLILLFNSPKALACALKSHRGLEPTKQTVACRALLAVKPLPKPSQQDFSFRGPNLRRLWQKINYIFFTDPFTFKFDVLHEKVRVILIFERIGWGWKLTRLLLPHDAIPSLSLSPAKAP